MKLQHTLQHFAIKQAALAAAAIEQHLVRKSIQHGLKPMIDGYGKSVFPLREDL
jgi:hypothetical protein